MYWVILVFVEIPLQITLRRLSHSEAVETAVREKVQKLGEFCDDIMSCRVMVELPHRHNHKGKLYHIRIYLTLPHEQIVVKRDPRQHTAHEDIYVAIRDAFDAAKRQLQDYVRRRRHQVKRRPIPQLATVLTVFPERNYGLLRTADGRDVYFHRNSLVGMDFERLDPGTEVHYVEEQGNEGPQAASVTLSKHHTRS